MALPQTEEHWSATPGPAGSADWDSLRKDLESLLHKVENSHLRPDAPREGPARARREAALREVQRAVARFSEPAHPATPTVPRGDLQAAIDEIRARTLPPQTAAPRPAAFRMPPPRHASHYKPPQAVPDYNDRAPRPAAANPVPHQPDTTTSAFFAPAAAPAPQAGRALFSGRYAPAEPREAWHEAAAPQRGGDRSEAIAGLTQLTAAVNGMAGRLEKLEADMHASRAPSGDVAEIAAQVGQLTHVVELLAGAVGEQGQIKRLESQIADLARLYADGPRPEIGALTRRFDELGATVERLADLQVQQIGRQSREAEAGGQAGQGETMRAIEAGVRSIYDRIDALEASYAVSPDELDRLTREMGVVAEALRQSGDGTVLSGILQRLESLSGQIDIMGRTGDSSVSDLRDAVETLRDAVGEAVEPRFAAIESRLETLSKRVGAPAPAPSFTALEDQIRQLAQRMDQTGVQLTGLTELYRAESRRPAQPDLEALASMVAERTSREVARLRGDELGLDETGLDALEKRLSKLFTDSRSVEGPGLLNDVVEGLTRVDERLDRLEDALEILGRRPAAPAATMPGAAPVRIAVPAAREAPPVAPPAPVPGRSTAPAPARPATTGAAPFASEPSFSEPQPMPRTPRLPQQGDGMPHAPNAERPLVDDELSALVAPVEDWSVIGFDEPAPRERRPAPGGLPGFDVTKIEKPARPRSSFTDDGPTGFMPMEEPLPEPDLADEPPAADRNTFIAAARRAARSTALKTEAEAPQSLIGKALARFQSKAAATGAAPVAQKFEPVPESRARLEDFDLEADAAPVKKGAGAKRGLGLWSRHRRPLLLAAALVVASLLVLNLVVQRLAVPSAPAEAAAELTGTQVPGHAANSLVDPTPTGSIDPFIKMNLTQPVPTRQTLPPSLVPEPLSGTPTLDPTFTHSVPPAETAPEATAPAPIKLDLPPEKLGPLELRQAAADGDPRSQFEIGAIYTEGRVVPADFKLAATWYERAAAQGFAPAQYRLGNLYEHGDGLDTDLEQARLWYTRAAEAGNRLAMHNLASLYASGDLGEQQFAAAAEWFERAAEAGMTDSQFNLGMLYARGLGVAQDFKASYKWFALAAEEGDTDAAKSRDDIARSLNTADLAALKADIAAWHMAPINIPANFAPIGTWSPSFDPGQTITDRPVTEKVQKALARLGYDPGSIDGVMGPKTTEAIKDFEKATGMTPIGLVNPRLLAVLGSQPV